MAPMVKIAEDMKPPKLILHLAIMLARLLPKAPIAPSKNVLQLAFKRADRQIEAVANPLSYRQKPRLGTALNVLKFCDELYASVESLITPFMVLHGDEDKVTSCESSKDLYRKAGAADKVSHVI